MAGAGEAQLWERASRSGDGARRYPNESTGRTNIMHALSRACTPYAAYTPAYTSANILHGPQRKPLRHAHPRFTPPSEAVDAFDLSLSVGGRGGCGVGDGGDGDGGAGKARGRAMRKRGEGGGKQKDGRTYVKAIPAHDVLSNIEEVSDQRA